MAESHKAMIDKALKRLGKEIGHTEAAEILGVSESTIRRWREGDRRKPRKTVQAKLVRYVGGIAETNGQPAPTALDAIHAMRAFLDGLERQLAADPRGLSRFAQDALDAFAGLLGQIPQSREGTGR